MNINYMDIACVVAQASKCERKKVGAVLVSGDNIIGTGYNGTPRGSCNDCEDEKGVTHKHTIHAEENVILNALTSDLNGSVMYCTLSPCEHCAAIIVQKGIKAVYYKERYKSALGINYLNSNGVVCEKYI